MAEREMKSTELMGSHSHATSCGTKVHIYRRQERYIARGRYQNKPFGVTLGKEKATAEAACRRLLCEIDDGKFQRPSDSIKRVFPSTSEVARLSLRELCNEFLNEKRKIRGKKTANDYRGRLAPLIAFSEQPDTKKKWPLAMQINRDFATQLRGFLMNRQVTRNGSAAGTLRSMSPRQIKNCLETLRIMLNWAVRPEICKLPREFVNPVTADLVGTNPPKDPLRKAVLPWNSRLQILEQMDDWEFVNLSTLLVLPLRLEDVSGLLISDIDFDQQVLRLGTRCGGSDFNKGRVQVEMPLPDALLTLFRVCARGRSEGPLFLKRKAKVSTTRVQVDSFEQLDRHFQERLARAPAGTIQTEQDRKTLFRKLLESLGGMSSSYVGKQLRELIPRQNNLRPYDLRGSISQEMKQAGVAHLELRYLTEHSVNDIMNEYTGLEPRVEMQKYYDKVEPLLQAVARRTAQLEGGPEAA